MSYSRTIVSGNVGEQHHDAKITSTIAAEIRLSNESQRTLSSRYGVSQHQIWSVKSGKTWRTDLLPAPPNMPRWASRTTLRVTSIKVERLNDISEEDAWAEGCKRGDPTDNGGFFPADEPDKSGKCTVGWDDAKDWFADLWESINGEGSWDANPWVVAIGFEVV